MNILYVVGTRPNFIKMAPVIARLRERLPDAQHVVVHTGQHYDRAMSEIFLEELDIPEPDHLLAVGSGPDTLMTARVMERIADVLAQEQPDLVLVPGDVNSTLGASLAAAQARVPVGHIESGLRSYDPSMPEELNRVLTDRVSDLLFIHSAEAADNLAREGITDGVHFVGNTMIDSLVALEPRFRALEAEKAAGVERGGYLLVTLHRPALVDGPLLPRTIELLGQVATELPVVFPAHPRTAARLESIRIPARLRITAPVGYLEFLSLQSAAGGVLTDSGGVQEETTFLGVPCFTLRANTERPVTLTHGTNVLLGLDPEQIPSVLERLGEGPKRPTSPPPLWDGHAAERVADVVAGRA
ncbi:MAG: UDP-N-acetylglucosamine 2-epimerase (non-hydrolyzing) [Thermoleophilaceae bacterium]|nr:UDP-N-acetylglucosamine 2-epimerase (non-hydrolyzing) [Thermoleophilaceae bacterium]